MIKVSIICSVLLALANGLEFLAEQKPDPLDYNGYVFALSWGSKILF